jgi:hypothetical protein
MLKWVAGLAFLSAVALADMEQQELKTRSHHMTLSGRTTWLDTGFDVIQEQSIEIVAEGEIQWKAEGKETCGPTGAVPYTRRGNKPILAINTGAIIGKIGLASTDYFYIGAGQRMIPFSTGRLFIGINDDNVRDNDGAFEVWIRHMN